MMNNSLSVCIITCNNETSVSEALLSIKLVADEVIIADNGSTDKTLALAEKFAETHPSVKIYSFSVDENINNLKNYLLRQASGDWVFFLNGDEILDAQCKKTLSEKIMTGRSDYYVKIVDGSFKTERRSKRLIRNFRENFHQSTTPVQTDIYLIAKSSRNGLLKYRRKLEDKLRESESLVAKKLEIKAELTILNILIQDKPFDVLRKEILELDRGLSDINVRNNNVFEGFYHYSSEYLLTDFKDFTAGGVLLKKGIKLFPLSVNLLFLISNFYTVLGLYNKVLETLTAINRLVRHNFYHNYCYDIKIKYLDKEYLNLLFAAVYYLMEQTDTSRSYLERNGKSVSAEWLSPVEQSSPFSTADLYEEASVLFNNEINKAASLLLKAEKIENFIIEEMLNGLMLSEQAYGDKKFFTVHMLLNQLMHNKYQSYPHNRILCLLGDYFHKTGQPGKARDYYLKVMLGKMMSAGRLEKIYDLFFSVLTKDIDGDVTELGCNQGQTAVMLQKLITNSGKNKLLHLFDSFEGMPDRGDDDGNTHAGKGQLATTEEVVINNFRKYNLKIPVINKGWFKDTLPHNLPEKICFAHLDGDFYSSIMESLQAVYPRLEKGAVVVIDDYSDEEIMNLYPGVYKACQDFFRDKPEKVIKLGNLDSPQAYFVKL